MFRRVLMKRIKLLSRSRTIPLALSKMSTNTTETDDLGSSLTKSFLSLDTIDPNIFRAPTDNLWHPFQSRFIFGGQVVGQALVAACNTVSPDHHVHSLHCYFLRGGNSNWPILYHVDRTRDGETYTSRSVKATQEGKAIFTMQASFKIDEEQGYTFTAEMPRVPPPDDTIDRVDYLKGWLKNDDTTKRERDYINRTIAQGIPVDIRPENTALFTRKIAGKPERLVWIRAHGHIGADAKLHQCVAAYISDFSLLATALQPGGPDYTVSFMTSLDHTIWFHNPFKADEWMLYESSSPYCGGGKALCVGRIWRMDGTLAMSVSQEGVVRTVPVPKL